MVISWILNALTKKKTESVLYSTTSKEIWGELDEQFGQSNGAQLFQIQKELNQISQGSSSIAVYYTKIKKLGDEIQALWVFPPCTCGEMQACKSFEEVQKLIQFLMGLNVRYTVVRGNILMLKPFPTVSQAYAILVQEEKQREVSSATNLILKLYQ